MKMLVACEYSGTVREAFAKQGWDAWSCDLLPTDIPSDKHIQDDCLKVIASQSWDLIIAHPPCTHLSGSGAAYWAEKVADGRQQAAIKFVEDIWDADCPRICIENPVGALTKRSKLGKATQYIQPYWFGTPESKRTGLWLKGLPKLTPTNMIDVSKLPKKEVQRLHYLPPSKDRWRIRSKTYQSIADQMSLQWTMPS